MFLTSTSWPQFLVMKSASEETLLSKQSLFAIQKGFEAIAGAPTSTRRLRDGSFLVECNRKVQAEILLGGKRFVQRPVNTSIHK